MLKTYEIQDLGSSKRFLSHNQQEVIITNPPGSIRYYGALTIDYMFKSLSAEFVSIKGYIFNVDHDVAGLLTAIDLGYTKIRYCNKLLIMLKNS